MKAENLKRLHALADKADVSLRSLTDEERAEYDSLCIEWYRQHEEATRRAAAFDWIDREVIR